MVQKAGFCGESGAKEGISRRFERICTMREGENKDYHGKRIEMKTKLYHEEILKWTYHGKEQK